MQKIEISHELEKALLKNILQFFKNSKTYTYKQVAKKIKATLHISLKELIVSNPSSLKIIIQKLNRSCPITMNKDKEFFEKLYKNFRSSSPGKKYVQTLDINVCPYCNRNYIFNFSKKKGTEATAQLDHFFDKSSYPYLALCIYNLAPSCSTCNLRKSKKQDDIFYPYEESFNDYVKFNYGFNDSNVDFFHKDKIEVKLNIKKSRDKAQSHIDVFNIQNLYNNHKEVILELIQKREIYSDSYIDELMQNFEGKIFGNRDELMRLITCGYVRDEDINKRPLSKLIKDISEELEFI